MKLTRPRPSEQAGVTGLERAIVIAAGVGALAAIWWALSG